MSRLGSPAPAQRSRKRKVGTDKAPNVKADEDSTSSPAISGKRRQRRTGTPSPPTSSLNSAHPTGEPTFPADTGLRTPSAKKARAVAVDRLAVSDTTLATLLSPETSRIITSKNASAPSPSATPTKQPAQTRLPTPKTAVVANILEEANRHLISVDPRMRPLIEKNHCRIFSPEGLAEKVDPFEALCSGIISQQVSGAAAASIKKRFIELFHEDGGSPDVDGKDSVNGNEGKKRGLAEGRRFPHPSQVVDMSLDKLRTAGFSQRKAEYVTGLAKKFVDGELSAQILADAPYEEVVTRLTAVRGLGLWSAEMFACFGLKRVDVFSLGDLGVQRGMAAFVGRDVAKLKTSKGGKFKYMSEAEMKEISDRFRPYRSLFMWYMWRVEQTDVSTME
ncbi:DNA glycosylase [Xylaria nigripes]|nr:DNA glycosylase [Xylaria nigripes]